MSLFKTTFIMKTRLSFLFAFIFLGLFSCQKDNLSSVSTPATDPAVSNRGTVTVPAGSVDALAAAIALAGPGGTVVLASGQHTESGTVTIGHKINLQGNSGAILTVNTAPGPTGYEIEPALHVLKAAGTTITGIDLRTPGAATGGTGILIERSDRVSVENCSIDNHQFSILVEKSNNCNLRENTITSTTAWQTGGVPEAHGIVVINGENAKISGNDVSNAFFGIWACDKNGHYTHNNTHHNYIGLILCKVPADALTLPDGTTTGAHLSATNCKVLDSNSHDNLDAGYLVIDGARANVLLSNNAGNNGTYDIELVGDSYRFGFFTPTSKNNLVKCGPYNGLSVKDCGMGNVVIGGVQVDTNLDPCF